MPTKISGIICVPSTNAEIGDLVSVITSGVFEFNISIYQLNIFDLVYLKILSESTYEISNLKQTDNQYPLGFANRIKQWWLCRYICFEIQFCLQILQSNTN